MKKFAAIIICFAMMIVQAISFPTAKASGSEPPVGTNGIVTDRNAGEGPVAGGDAPDNESVTEAVYEDGETAVDESKLSGDPADADIPTVTASNGQSISINDVNADILEADKLFLFTRDYHEKQVTILPWWVAAVVDVEDGSGNYLIRTIVSKVDGSPAEALDIPVNGFILLGHGAAAAFMNANLRVNDEIVMSGVALPEPITGSKILLENGTEHAIDGVNPAESLDNGIAIYSLEYGKATPSFTADTVEYIVVNDVVVFKNTQGDKGTRIPTTGYVLSLAGGAAETVGDLNVGDSIATVNVEILTLPSNYVAIDSAAAGKVYLGITKFNSERGSGDVVLFDPTFGASTKRNAWGMEFAYADGIVTQVTNFNGQPNDTPIPANGYVVSIHQGHPIYNQLNGKLEAGDKVELVREQFTYQASKATYDAYNPKVKEDNPAGWDEENDKPYGGFRGADQLIIYDEGYGRETTGTNGYGNEVVVNDKGYVVKNGGNDSVIPPGGMVLSGHGKYNTWLVQHAAIGSKVTIRPEKKQAIVILTPESYLERAEIDIETVSQKAAAAKLQFLDVPYERIERAISEAQTLLRQIKEAAAEEGLEGERARLDELNRLTTEAYYLTFESRKVDHRALWLRPKETNLQQVIDHLDRIQAVNINAIYLETWWNGYASFATEHPLTAMNPINKGFDVLDAYITEGHKRGIEIHAWVHNFFILPGAPVLEKHPEWLMYTREIKPGGEAVIQPSPDQTGLSLNPVDPGARQFISEVYQELLSKYDIDGLHHDYGRYPGSPADYSKDYGYEDYTRQAFKQEHGVDPAEVFPGDEKWDAWVRFRIDAINSFIERTVHEAKALKPDITITAAVWPNYHEAPYTHYQEVENWLDNNLLDNTFHMSYMPDWSVVVDDLEKTLDLAKNKSFSTSAVGTFINLTHTALMDQLDQVNRHGSAGTGIFEFESLFYGGYGDIVKLGSHREPAISPDHRKTEPVSLMFKELARKTDEIYVPYQGMSPEAAKSVADIASTLAAGLKQTNEMKLENAIGAKSGVTKIRSLIADNHAVHAEVKKRIEHDLDFIEYMLDVYAAKTGQSLEPVDPGTPSEPKPGTGSGSGGSVSYGTPTTSPSAPAAGSKAEYTVSHTDGVLMKDSALTVSRTDANGKTETSYLLHADALREGLDKLDGGNGKRIVTELDDEADTIRLGIPLASFLAGANRNKEALISLRTTDAVFEFPLGLKGIDGKVKQWGEQEQEKDAALYVVIHKSKQRPAVNGGGFASEIYEFALVIESDGAEIAAIDDLRDPLIGHTIIVHRPLDTDTATAVAVDPSGKLSFVPSFLRVKDGKTIVEIMRNTSGRYAVIQSAETFPDTAGHWAQSEIERLASKRIVQGVDDRSFAPNAKVTRAELAALLVRALGLTDGTGAAAASGADAAGQLSAYSDVQRTDWFAGAVDSAAKAGIVNGFADGSFRPDEVVTREQMAAMMARAFDFAGTSPARAASANPIPLETFADSQAIAAWAQAAVAVMVEAGVYQGRDDGTIAPQSHVSRGEAVVALQRFLRTVHYIN
ncbi:hypothetical protein PAE9249_00657 [Paenibacillus sp. CECT 9249]|uniref:S-layer homology domain-containing protein n=1 Tax=Paenibacillus sp. CECT 9249 TaxID=2845385 RepID=UPI001E4B5B75|nr:S-layer homology domain-containing protein [Paenibacillus sp. CECT 9249]CAH0118191.1 hypothetical protein PAE9249_00657 [Paenibacillus sp. CECT 9249]